MSKQLISDKALDAAFDYLNENSDKIAAARANVLRMEYKVKAVKARLVLTADGAMGLREAYAVSSPEYAAVCEEHVKSVEAWEFATDQRNRAQYVIEAWRTENASRRAIDRIR